MLLSAGIECSTACRSCGAGVPVNACVSTVHCPGCGVACTLTAGGWATRLHEPLARIPRFTPGEGSSGREVDPDGEFDLQFVRLEPPCGACGAEIALEAIESGAPRGFLDCSGCHARISIRRLPAEHDAALLKGVRFLVGESLEQLGGAVEKTKGEAIAIRCPGCGASLETDGSARTVICRYCQATAMLPDDVWLRLHPPKGPSRWFVIFEAADASRRARAIAAKDRFHWFLVEDVIGDAEGNVYAFGCGEGFDDLIAWSFSPAGELRWARHRLKRKGHDHVHVDLTANGELLVHGKNAHEAIRLSTKDGATLGTLGAAKAPLDFREIEAFACDHDGTFLAIRKNRLQRFAANGSAIAAWPPRPAAIASPSPPQRGWLARFFFGDPPVVEPQPEDPSRIDFAQVGDAPESFGNASSPSLAIGHCGALYVKAHDGDTTRVLKLERSGRRVYSVEVPCATFGVADHRMGGDAKGNAYVLGYHAGEENSACIYKISPDGRSLKCIVRGRAEGGPLERTDVRMAIDGGGSIAIVGENGLKIFDADGALRVAWDDDD